MSRAEEEDSCEHVLQLFVGSDLLLFETVI